MQKLFETALEEAQKLHKTNPIVKDFVEFPDDCTWRDLEALPIPAASLMAKDLSLDSMETSRMRDAFIKPWEVACWRETYKDTNIGEDFLLRFACYELFGHAGHFQTQKARGFLVYSDANLYYPWHHHPAEELYFIIAGEASFATEGNAPKLLKPGDTVFHASNQPHNMQTHDKGVLAYVVWRNEFDIAPVLTDRLNG